MEYINNYCIKTNVEKFKSLEKSWWMKEMIESFRKVHPATLSDGQIKAWENEFDVLKKSLNELPSSYDKIWIIFEYVMPKRSPDSKAKEKYTVRPDILLLSNDTVVVLEFKQRKELYKEGDGRQIRKRGKPARKILRKGDVFSTHAEALNVCFGYGYESYQLGYKAIDVTYSAWFPTIAKRIEGEYAPTENSMGWINILSDNDTVITEKNYDEKKNTPRDKKYELNRFVFAKFDGETYRFIGVYKPDYDKNNVTDDGYRYKLLGTTVDLQEMKIL